MASPMEWLQWASLGGQHWRPFLPPHSQAATTFRARHGHSTHTAHFPPSLTPPSSWTAFLPFHPPTLLAGHTLHPLPPTPRPGCCPSAITCLILLTRAVVLIVDVTCCPETSGGNLAASLPFLEVWLTCCKVASRALWKRCLPYTVRGRVPSPSVWYETGSGAWAAAGGKKNPWPGKNGSGVEGLRGGQAEGGGKCGMRGGWVKRGAPWQRSCKLHALNPPNAKAGSDPMSPVKLQD